MSSQDFENEAKKPKKLLGVRHFQALMLFLGMVLIYCIRVCMSMAIVAMTDHTRNNTFEWSLQTQSIILSSFNWGYVVLQIPGGELAARFGGMALLTCCVGVSSIVALLIPVCAYYYNNAFRALLRLPRFCSASGMFAAAHTDGFHALMRKKVASLMRRVRGSSNGVLSAIAGRFDCPIQRHWVSVLLLDDVYRAGWPAVCACRIIQGMIQGFLNPSMHNLISKWVPKEERSRLGTIIYAGSHLGTALQLMTAGFIAESWSWTGIFYVNGSLGAVWTAVYLFVGSNSPQSSKIISVEEQMYIQKSLGQVGEQKRLPTPWKALLTSLPFISLVVAHSGSGFGYWTLLYELPTYQHKVLGVNIKANGMMSALPYLIAYLMSFVFGFMSDYILKRNWLSVTACRKVSNSCGTFGPAVALVILSCIPPSIPATIVILTCAFGIKAGTFTGYNLVHLDMAPNFAGTMIGVSGSVCNLVALTAPLVAGALVHDDTAPSEWRKVFLLASAIYVATNTFFLIFGTSEKQAWNDPAPDSNKHSEDAQSAREMERIL